MAKALYGFMGEPRAALLLKQVADLKTRIIELERALEAAEADVLALRAIAESRIEAEPQLQSVKIEERALA